MVNIVLSVIGIIYNHYSKRVVKRRKDFTTH